jgi:exodeoxyribonuclease VII small subunit
MGWTRPSREDRGYSLRVSKPAKSKSPDLSFEDALAQIEQIIDRIESGEIGLEQSLAEYERGVGLINHCRGRLEGARQQIEDLTRKLQSADEPISGAGDEQEEPDDPARQGPPDDDGDSEQQDE